MRFRPRNHRDENPEVFAQLVKTNPYMARVFDYPELLIPHPTPENFQQLWDSKKENVPASSGRVHLEIGCGSGRYLIEWAQENPKDAFIGLELRYKRLVLAAKKIEQQTISNIILMREHGEFIDESSLEQYNQIEIPENESYAANCIWINESVIIPLGYPTTKQRIKNAGYEIVETDVSEFQKLDGGLSCLSLRY